ncbi:MAG: hypothetical protein LBK91_04580 [Synergistaceae bacterium]|jgi:hypothetical protein|nr:hypothetical protein [Synergistaceae bacterium]
MKKTTLYIILVAIVGIAAAGYFFYSAPRTQPESYTTEAALPAAPDADYTVVLKLTDTSPLKSFITGVSSLISEYQTDLTRNISSDTVSALETIASLLDATAEISLLAASQSEEHVLYISLLADETAFNSVMAAPPSKFYTSDKWDSGIANSEGWTIKTPGDVVLLYVLKRPGGEKTQILAANTEQAISGMISARDGKSPRFSPERTTSGASFFQVRLKNGFTYGMLDDVLVDLLPADLYSYMAQFAPTNRDQVIFTVNEYSSTRNGNVVTTESYSDLFEKNPGLTARHPKSAVTPRLMGDGELAYFIACDTGFLLSSIFPWAEDPAQEAFKLFGVSPLFSNDLKEIISSARISIACAIKDNALSTIYVLLETDAPESLDKLYSMIGFLGLPGTELQGWDSAVSTPIPYIGIPSAQNVVLAHGQGSFLAGVGSIADFAKTPAVKNEHKEFLSHDDILNGFVTSNIYNMLLGMILTQNTLPQSENRIPDADEAIAAITTIRDSFDFFAFRIDSSGRGHGKEAFTEGGDFIGAMFEVLLRAARQRPGSISGGASDATRIINDLRNLKGSALMYYVDENEWPPAGYIEGDLAKSIDRYMDRPWISANRYERVWVKSENVDGKEVFVIGVTLKDDDTDESIRKLLAGSAEERGLLSDPKTVYTDGADVGMRIN